MKPSKKKNKKKKHEPKKRKRNAKYRPFRDRVSLLEEIPHVKHEIIKTPVSRRPRPRNAEYQKQKKTKVNRPKSIVVGWRVKDVRLCKCH